MNDFSFDSPSRQSSKGIIVIFGVSLYKFIKRVAIFFLIFFVRFVDVYATKVILGACIGVLFFIAYSLLKYVNFKFYVTEDYFILHQGILNKEETSIAKTKIQNVYIKQNFIQQLINVVSLSIETAGDNKTEIEIQALTVAKANALKRVLLENRAQEQYETTKNDGSLYYKVSIKKLLLEGVSENHFRSFIFILFFIIGLYNDFKDFLESLNIKTRFDGYFAFSDTEILSLLIFNFALVFVLLFIAFLFSLIKTFLENFNLKVTSTNKGLEISKGLFNKVSLVLEPNRIQNTIVKTNRLKQWLGLYKLNFTQAMVNKKQQKHFTIIGLNKFKVDELIQKFYPNIFSSVVKLKPEKYFIYRSTLSYIIVLALLNLIFSFISVELFLINIPFVIFASLSIIYSYKKAYYSIDENYLIVGSGKLVDINTNFLELHKVQGVALKQTIFQKRRTLASVMVYSSTNAVTIPHIKEENAKSIIDFLLFKIESSKKDWM
ncbi:PH domain-containing protein [uncultured Psychroserpens sp.]|uniref:PH domain-containing protein n=1 Tax=uncultured Psychroserpens sp. TaxID=255436 RepID=UPI002624AE0D|nr:PH domain-containing protein [uncultured Psychroserpens sp.]